MRRLALLFACAGGCGFLGEAPFAGVRTPDVSPWQDVGPLVVCDGTTRLAALAEGPAGLCALPSAGGASCRADGDCRSRERCMCGRCTVAVCDSNDECAQPFTCTFDERRCDRPCTADSECASGESCDPGKHVCRSSGCAANADCQNGETCQRSTGRCLTSACADDSTCFGGRTCTLQRVPTALAEPSPVFDVAGNLFLYFERQDPGAPARIYRARAGDDAAGLAFAIEPRTPLFDGRAPSVTRGSAPGSMWLVAYEDATGIALRSAPDGVAFGAPSFFAAGREPTLVLNPDATLWVYFADAAGNVVLKKSPSAPPLVVLSPSALTQPFLWDGVDLIASPFAQPFVRPDGTVTVRLWFSAHGIETAPTMQFGRLAPEPPNWSIGEASATDGKTFQPFPFNPVFDRVVDFTHHPSELDPAVIDLGSEWHLYYRRAAPDGSASQNLAMARTPPRTR